MHFRTLILCAAFLTSTSPSVFAQGLLPSSKVIGIHWNGFADQCNAYGLVTVAAEPTVDKALFGHDLPSIPSPYSYRALGFFCKAEVKLNSLLPFPVMMRLGDVRRAEELDGKGDPLSAP